MKVISVNKEVHKMIIYADFWDIEIMGYDTVRNRVVDKNFYSTLLLEIKNLVKEYLGEKFTFGVKSYVDNKNKCMYYEITSYEKRINEFVLEEMIKEQRSFTFLFPNGVM